MPDSKHDPDSKNDLAPPLLPGIVLESKAFRHSRRAALYRGWDRVHLRDVLVKVQTEDGDPAALAHFRREAALMVRLRHPGIANVYQFREGVTPAAVIETVSGRTLDSQVRAHGALNLKRAAKIIEDVAAALDCVHAHGIVHRGITPATIVLPLSVFPVLSRSVKLTEFGVARVAEILVSSEPSAEVNSDFSSLSHFRIADDLSALAAVAYFALTGISPRQDAELLPLRLHRPELPLTVEAVVLRGLAKAPNAHYASAGQFAADLRAAIETALSDPNPVALTSVSRRTGVLAGGLVGTAMLLGAGLLWKTEHLTPVRPFSHPLLGHAIQPSHSAQPKPIASSVLPKAAPMPPPATKTAPAVPVPPREHTPLPPASSDVAAVPSVSVPSRILPSSLSIRRSQPNSKSVTLSQPSVSKAAVLSKAAVSRPSKDGAGFLLIYAKQNVAPLGQSPVMADVPAHALSIDGKAVPVPPPGGWITLPAGRHQVSYYPDGQSKFGPRLILPVMVASGAHVRKQIPLPLALGRPIRRSTAIAASAPRSVGWYTVSGWAAIPSPSQNPDQSPDQTPKSTLVRAAAQQVVVDGQPNLNLALGQWAELPAGKHTIVFQPATGLGVGPKTWDITVTPLAHLNQQIPLPAIPVGWYTVSGWAALPSPDPDQNSKSTLVRANARRVMVDGQPNLKLMLGQWAELPAGQHTITFQPGADSWVGAKTWDISLDPQAHLNQQVPLPPLPVGWYTVSGWIPVPTDDPASPDQKSTLVRASAQWIMVDNQPNLTLTLGQWAELPAGQHRITFLPTHGVNAAPKTWDITLHPLARLNQQVPLPPAVPTQ